MNLYIIVGFIIDFFLMIKIYQFSRIFWSFKLSPKNFSLILTNELIINNLILSNVESISKINKENYLNENYKEEIDFIEKLDTHTSKIELVILNSIGGIFDYYENNKKSFFKQVLKWFLISLVLDYIFTIPFPNYFFIILIISKIIIFFFTYFIRIDDKTTDMIFGHLLEIINLFYYWTITNKSECEDFCINKKKRYETIFKSLNENEEFNIKLQLNI